MTTQQPNDGGPAYPVPGLQHDEDFYGMSLRDYFAAHASDSDVKDQAEILRAKLILEIKLGVLPDDWRATCRYMHADAMLKARGQ